MEHLGTTCMETPRLTLRPFVLEDADAMFANWASDPAVTRYLTWPAHESVTVTRKILEEWIASYEQAPFYQWAIVPKEVGEPIGSISVVSQREQARMMEIGYCIGRAWWHQGIVREALRAVLAFLFDQVGVNRVQARFDPRNTRSGKVMLACGMQYEGTLRQADWDCQGICDISYCGILAEEYRRQKEQKG